MKKDLIVIVLLVIILILSALMSVVYAMDFDEGQEDKEYVEENSDANLRSLDVEGNIAGDGSEITNLDADHITSGTLNNAQLPDNIDADTINGLNTSAFAMSAHTHDDRYYSKSDIDTNYYPKSDIDTNFLRLSGGTLTGDLYLPNLQASGKISVNGGDSEQWNTAYGWGDHSLAGYLKIESDPVFSASVAAGINNSDILNWNTAFTERLNWDGGSTGLDPVLGRASLGLGSLATLDTINNDNWDGTELAVDHGGTGATSPAGARTNLGLVAGGAGDIWVEKAGDTMVGDLIVNGKIGIGIANPSAALHIDNGGLLITGSTGSTPISGAGTRLMWIPERAALRAGYVNGAQWDHGNIGNYSIAFGANTTASGNYSTAIGNNINALGHYSFGINLDSTPKTINQDNTMAIMGGRVGIGERYPVDPLHILCDSDGDAIHIEEYSGGEDWQLGVDSTGDLNFEDSGTTRITFEDNTGYVGIGTVNPTSLLEVQGGNVYIDSIGFGGTPTIDLAIGDTDTGFDSAGDGDLDIYSNNNLAMSVRNNNVGIGTTTPGYRLHVVGGTTSIVGQGTQAGGSFEDTSNSGYAICGYGDYGIYAGGNTMGGYFEDPGSSGIAQCGDGNYGVRAYGDMAGVYGEDLTSSCYGYLGYGFYGVRGYGVSSGTSSATGVYGVAVTATSGTNYGVYGNGGNSGTGAAYDFYAGGSGTNYGPFTGAHEVKLSVDFPENIKPGMIVSVTGESYIRKINEVELSYSSTMPTVKLSNTPKDTRVFGAITTECRLDEDHWYYSELKDGDRFGVVNALGEGVVWVTNFNGDIMAGDYITTSAIAGYGQKQSDDLLHSYTFGKATEDVNWSEVTETVEFEGKTYKACAICVVYTSG